MSDSFYVVMEGKTDELHLLNEEYSNLSKMERNMG